MFDQLQVNERQEEAKMNCYLQFGGNAYVPSGQCSSLPSNLAPACLAMNFTVLEAPRDRTQELLSRPNLVPNLDQQTDELLNSAKNGSGREVSDREGRFDVLRQSGKRLSIDIVGYVLGFAFESPRIVQQIMGVCSRETNTRIKSLSHLTGSGDANAVESFSSYPRH